jgi:hypothetical protein
MADQLRLDEVITGLSQQPSNPHLPAFATGWSEASAWRLQITVVVAQIAFHPLIGRQ